MSRSIAKVLALFDLELQRQAGEWETLGDLRFLRMERHVHQLARLAGRHPLRLEATYWSAPLIEPGIPADWMLGRSNVVGVRRNFQLLEERIVDAWLAGLPDGPTAAQPELTAIALTRMPVFFTCAPGHPLLRCERIGYDDIARYPTLALPAGAYPRVEAALKHLQLWSDGVRMHRYRRDLWEGKTEAELVVGYGTPLSMRVSGGSLCRLPLQLPFASGDALVIRRDQRDHPRIQALLHWLGSVFREIAKDCQELEVVAP